MLLSWFKQDFFTSKYFISFFFCQILHFLHKIFLEQFAELLTFRRLVKCLFLSVSSCFSLKMRKVSFLGVFLWMFHRLTFELFNRVLSSQQNVSCWSRGNNPRSCSRSHLLPLLLIFITLWYIQRVRKRT